MWSQGRTQKTQGTQVRPTGELQARPAQGGGCSRGQPGSAAFGTGPCPGLLKPLARGRGLFVHCGGQYLMGLFGSRLHCESEKPLCSSHNMVTELWCLFPHLQRGTISNFSFLKGGLQGHENSPEDQETFPE